MQNLLPYCFTVLTNGPVQQDRQQSYTAAAPSTYEISKMRYPIRSSGDTGGKFTTCTHAWPSQQLHLVQHAIVQYYHKAAGIAINGLTTKVSNCPSANNRTLNTTMPPTYDIRQCRPTHMKCL